MLADLGFGLMVLTFVTAIFSAVAAVVGVKKKDPRWIESSRRGMILQLPLVSLVVLVLLYLLVNNHYEVKYVYSVTSLSMPLYLKLTALWGGQAGSLLFWAWLLSIFTTSVMLRNWERDKEFLPWVVVVTSLTMVFFLSLNIFFENPFIRWWSTVGGETAAMFKPVGAVLINPGDGTGLNPLLRHPGMIIHPPMLYLGFVAFIIPFAFAVAALITGRTDDRWIRITRRWTLWAWLFLSIGLVLGARWAYDVLGWGGYWGWDPVEIAAFMPWLTGTAFLHSVMIQEKRGMLKQWNMLLIILTYDLVIFGTFLTRSGVLSSVHAFAQSAIGPMFFSFIGLTFIVSVGLLMHRWNELKSENPMTSVLSREALFLLNNLLFMGILIVCFWGVIFPLISELATGQKVTVGPPFYERATAPLFASLMVLMALAPLAAWGHSTIKTLGKAIWKPALLAVVIPVVVLFAGIRNFAALIGFFLVALVIFVTIYEIWRGSMARHKKHKEGLLTSLMKLVARNRRRYGGYIIHISMVLMAIGILGIEIFQTQTQGTIPQGSSLTLDNYTVTFDSVAQFDTAGGRNVTRAVLSVYEDGKFVGQVFPRRDYYYESQQPMTIPGLRSNLKDDLYVILVDWQPISAVGATFKIYKNPLVNWLWIGAIVFIAGMFIAAWPDNKPIKQEIRRSRMVQVPGTVK
ncbi:MAG TPA: heme lyase CcmF/NrfE family subunit [Anaerolineales bacterium]|nr:heme lyase CcmF/NrfE family subunit [Anaerolineales bacterium]